MNALLISPRDIPILSSAETRAANPAESPHPAGLIRGVRAICNALEIAPRLLYPTLLALWWQAWRVHPAYETYYQPDALGYTPPTSLLRPQVMGAWEHEPGRGGHRESYVVGVPADVLASLDWGQRTYGGHFVGLRPILSQAPVSRQRIATWAFSYKGAGGAYVARMELKRLLPRPVHPWIGRARVANARPKYHLYPFKVDPRRPRRVPAEYAAYRTRTKGQIWLDEVLPAHVRRIIGRYLPLEDFWRAATGRLHPNEVEPLIRRHIRGVWVEDEAPVPRPVVLPPDDGPPSSESAALS